MSPSVTRVALSHAVSGAAGTAASTAAVFPIDLATTRLKAQRLTHGYKQNDGLWNSLRSIVENEGGKSALYTGLGPSVAKSAMDSFLFFGFYSYLRSRSRHPGVVRELATGAIAGTCARFLTTPISTVVTRLQLSAQSKTLLHTLVEVYSEAGISGLWSGYSATLFLTMNPSITFFVNRRLANHILPALEDEDIPIAWVAFILAALSKSIAILLTYPLQMGRLRLQMTRDSHNNASLTDEMPRPTFLPLKLLNKTIIGVIFQIIRREGSRALYDGLRGELLTGFLSHGLTMFIKGLALRLAKRLWRVLQYLIYRGLYPKYKS